MNTLEDLFRNNRLSDPDDIDALLEAAEITRQLLCGGRYPDLSRLIGRTVEDGCFEAFSWIMAVLQEEYGKLENAGLNDFTCELGRAIPHYSDFAQRLGVDFNVIGNDFEKTFDGHGEVRSFFNIFRYKTAYPNIFLVTEENFDLMDNDFIRYKLLFTRNPEKN